MSIRRVDHTAESDGQCPDNATRAGPRGGGIYGIGCRALPTLLEVRACPPSPMVPMQFENSCDSARPAESCGYGAKCTLGKWGRMSAMEIHDVVLSVVTLLMAAAVVIAFTMYRRALWHCAECALSFGRYAMS